MPPVVRRDDDALVAVDIHQNPLPRLDRSDREQVTEWRERGLCRGIAERVEDNSAASSQQTARNFAVNMRFSQGPALGGHTEVFARKDPPIQFSCPLFRRRGNFIGEKGGDPGFFISWHRRSLT